MRKPPTNGKACLEWSIQLPAPVPTDYDVNATLLPEVFGTDKFAVMELEKDGATCVGDALAALDLTAERMKDHFGWKSGTRVGNIRAKIADFIRAHQERQGKPWADQASIEALNFALFQLFRRSKNTAFISHLPKIVVRYPDYFLSVRAGLQQDHNKHHVLRLLTAGDDADPHWHLIPPLTDKDDGMVGT